MLKNIKNTIKRKLRTYRNRILKRINKVIEFFKLKTKGITIENTSYVTRTVYFISIIVLISIIIGIKNMSLKSVQKKKSTGIQKT